MLCLFVMKCLFEKTCNQNRQYIGTGQSETSLEDASLQQENNNRSRIYNTFEHIACHSVKTKRVRNIRYKYTEME